MEADFSCATLVLGSEIIHHCDSLVKVLKENTITQCCCGSVFLSELDHTDP